MGSIWITAVNVIVSPEEAFRRLREQPKVLFPLVLLVVLTAGIVAWYYSAVDLAWLLEMQMQGAMPDGQAAALEDGAARNVVGTIAAVAAGGGLVLGLVVSAAYLALVSMLTNDGGRFGLWFSLVAWCSLPMVFSSLATGVNLLVNDLSRLPPEQLNPLTFRSLLGIEGELPRSPRFFANLNPFVLWTLVLVVLGYHSWTSRAILKSASIVLGPIVVLSVLVLLLS